MARIITLITDFRTTDGYMGAVYGVLKSINPDIEIITITSNIPPADVHKASRAISNSTRFFPEGTIHMAIVDPTVGRKRRPILINDNRYFYVGPDNGIFTPVFKMVPDFKCYYITSTTYCLGSDSQTFQGRDLFAPVAAYLSLGVPPEEFGSIINDPILIEDPLPEKVGEGIMGHVINIDGFGNLVTNIPSDMVKQDLVFKVCGHKISGLSESYADVGEKQSLAYIGSTGFLEIAVNGGHAANYFGASMFEEVKVFSADN